jgi:hypothetical protein
MAYKNAKCHFVDFVNEIVLQLNTSKSSENAICIVVISF